MCTHANYIRSRPIRRALTFACLLLPCQRQIAVKPGAGSIIYTVLSPIVLVLSHTSLTEDIIPHAHDRARTTWHMDRLVSRWG